MIALVGLLLVAGNAAPHDPRCDSVKTADLIDCAQSDADRADAALNAAWKVALAKARGWEANIGAEARADNKGVTYSRPCSRRSARGSATATRSAVSKSTPMQAGGNCRSSGWDAFPG